MAGGCVVVSVRSIASNVHSRVSKLSIIAGFATTNKRGKKPFSLAKRLGFGQGRGRLPCHGVSRPIPRCSLQMWKASLGTEEPRPLAIEPPFAKIHFQAKSELLG